MQESDQLDLCEIVITGPKDTWMQQFCKELVEERLCACVNIDENVHSVYRWEGKIYEEIETKARIHTKVSLSDKIIKKAKLAHPYSEPSIIVTPIIGGSDTYLDWIRSETI